MNAASTFFFVCYPYICLVLLFAGLWARYVHEPGTWNAHSTEFMERQWLVRGSVLFHYGILPSLVGHLGGLFLTEWAWNILLFGHGGLHRTIALTAGQIVVPLILAGMAILVWRHREVPKVRAVTTRMDYVILALILFNALTGAYQVYVVQTPVFEGMGAWLRGVVTLQPDASLLDSVPMFMKLHAVSAFTIFALTPFSRLVHVLSAPFTYIIRPFVIYRRRYADL